MFKITKEDIGRKVLMKNNIEGVIKIFDNSTMPVYVRHDVQRSFLVTGTWHYTDGTYSNRNMEHYDIVCFLEDGNQKINKNECRHEWKDYLGLSESFRYCTKCDKKEY